MSNRRMNFHIMCIGVSIIVMGAACKPLDFESRSVSNVQKSINVDITVTGMGHYCSIIENDGTWRFDFDPAGGDPCGDVGQTKFGTSADGKIKRAGLYRSGTSSRDPNENNLVVRCQGGYTRTYPDANYSVITDTTLAQIRTDTQQLNLLGCIFTLAPKRLPIFTWPIATPQNSSIIYGFDFTRDNYSVTTTNCSNSFMSTISNYTDVDKTCAPDVKDNSDGYFFGGSNFTPLFAVAAGAVLKARTRETDCWPSQCNASSHLQGELYIEHNVMSGSINDPHYERYIEKFVTAYYHIYATQTTGSVSQGNQVAVIAGGGCTNLQGALFAVYRLTNTASNYLDKLTISADNNKDGASNDGDRIAIDPYGYSGTVFDPWGSYADYKGALSINLWINSGPNRSPW